MWTAIPPTLSPISWHSPVCSPALISIPSGRTPSRMAQAQRIARAGPSKVAKNPSPAVSTSSAIPLEFPPHDPVMRVEEGAPWTVGQCRGALGRAYDVGEEHGGEDAVDFRDRPHAGKELLGLAQHRLSVTHEEEVVLARQLHILRLPDVVGEVAAVAHPHEAVARSM
jgi:hypothetical protein